MSTEELQVQRDAWCDMARVYDAHVYGLTSPDWHGAFINFPFTPGEASHTWTGYWERYEPASGVPPVLFIGTAARSDVEWLRTSMRADHARTGGPLPDRVRFAGRQISAVVPLYRTETSLCVAEVFDGDVYVLITTAQPALLPHTITVAALDDREPLILGWANQ